MQSSRSRFESTSSVDATPWKRYSPPVVFPNTSLSEIMSRIPLGSSVLDVGCSEGYVAQILGERANVWGLDGNPAAVAVAATHCADAGVANFNGSLAPAFDGRLFDVVLFADVLEHLLDPSRVLRHYAQQLKPNGRIIVSLPNVAHVRVRLDLLQGRFQYRDYGIMDTTHVHFYTFKTGRSLVEDAGLRVTEIVGVDHSHRRMDHSRRLEPFKAFLRRFDELLAHQMLITARPLA
jgi:methionine biosynthesis protein MetW